MRVQERKIILNNLDKLIKDNLANPQLTEGLYCLGVELSDKYSPELGKYSSLLQDFRNKNYETIDPMPIGEFGKFWSSNGYYKFNFDNPEIARRCVITRSMLKDYFNFTWITKERCWAKKQSNISFNIDHFNEVILEKIKQDLK